jgi:mRNA interferase HicA
LLLIDFVYKFVYNLKGKPMKKRDLEKQLREAGWRFARHGGNHDAWTNGELFEFVPRHAEIKEMLAKKILKKAKANPPKEK